MAKQKHRKVKLKATHSQDRTAPGPAEDKKEVIQVIIEMLLPSIVGQPIGAAENLGFQVPSFQRDYSYQPVPLRKYANPELTDPINAFGDDSQIVVIRGSIEEDRIPELKAQPNVHRVYKDEAIFPFDTEASGPSSARRRRPATRGCPIVPCDCNRNVAKGTIDDVATYLGVKEIWQEGYKGAGVVIGIVDGGITAEGREAQPGETARRIPNVVGGWPESNWGTTAKNWNEHGNMMATDALGMAPEASLYDLRLSQPVNVRASIEPCLSDAIQAYDWAIEQYIREGKPQILLNSWGIRQKFQGPNNYATDASHAFTLKVLEAISEGIIVLFAAGNCGNGCVLDSACGSDFGPGNSILGANGHTSVITVGAANKNEEFIGYSSQGPSTLFPHREKPDFCSISHFKGYTDPDKGTSTACAVAAGVVALLKQKKSTLTQDEAKEILKRTAKNIGVTGEDPHSGAGIIQAKTAYDQL
jgi:serine protease AprX